MAFASAVLSSAQRDRATVLRPLVLMIPGGTGKTSWGPRAPTRLPNIQLFEFDGNDMVNKSIIGDKI